MGKKRAQRDAGAAAAGAQQQDVDPRSELLGRFVGVPTDFFGVSTDGARYLGQVTIKHPTQKTMVWVKFVADNKEVFVPWQVAKKWVITDEAAEDEDAEWYQVPTDDEESEDEDEEPPRAADPAAANAGARDEGTEISKVRGRIKNGKWKPTKPKDPPHAIDNLVWRKASGPINSHQPVVFDREPPEGQEELTPPGLRKPLDPKRPVMLQLFERQWGRSTWEKVQKYSRIRSKYLGLGTPSAVSHKANIDKRNGDGSKNQCRPKPLYSLPFLIRLHVIIQAMGIMRLPARKYYWKNGAFIGCKAVKDLMTQKEFDQGMRGLYACDHTKQMYHGDWQKPPPEGYDKLFKTRELDTEIMHNTLTAYAPKNKFSNDECSEPKQGKNGEGAAVSFNKDKPNKWATRVQCFNEHNGARIVWHVLNLPKRYASEWGETYRSTLDLVKLVSDEYGSGFEVSQDSMYNRVVTIIDAAIKYKWNLLGTAVLNGRGMPDDVEEPSETRGDSVSYYATASVGAKKVPLTVTLLQDSKLTKFLTSAHGIPKASEGRNKSRWNKSTRQYEEVSLPSVKVTYDRGKVGSDLFGQHMAMIRTTFKSYHPWIGHYLWLYQGCFVNAHCWRNDLIDSGDPVLAGCSKRTLVDDTLQTMDELLAWAESLEDRGSTVAKKLKKRKRGGEVCQVAHVAPEGFDAAHPPASFKGNSVPCLVCRKKLRTGCGHVGCGHLHKGKCWRDWHRETDPAKRAKFKTKRVQAMPRSPSQLGVTSRKSGRGKAKPQPSPEQYAG